MPCRDDYPANPEHTVLGIKAKLIPLLCEACDLLEKKGLLDQASADLRAWAKEHEAEEFSRIRREALDKLSPKERRALGLE